MGQPSDPPFDLTTLPDCSPNLLGFCRYYQILTEYLVQGRGLTFLDEGVVSMFLLLSMEMENTSLPTWSQCLTAGTGEEGRNRVLLVPLLVWRKHEHYKLAPIVAQGKGTVIACFNLSSRGAGQSEQESYSEEVFWIETTSCSLFPEEGTFEDSIHRYLTGVRYKAGYLLKGPCRADTPV